MTVRFLSRVLAPAALVLPLALVGAIGVPSSAQAVTGTPTPLSVLPSQIVSGTTPTTGGALADSQAVRMAQVWKFVTSPDVVAALKSQQAGTATKTETDLIAAAAKNIKIPTGLGTLVKGAGAAGVAYTGYTVGTSLGSLAADGITTSLWGIDSNDLVCSAADGVGQGFLSFFAGQDCADFNATKDQVINGDAVGSRPPGWVYYPVGWGCSDPAVLSTCYTGYTFNVQPQAVTGDQPFTVSQMNEKGNGGVYLVGSCRNDATGAITNAFGGDSRDFSSSRGFVQSWVINCQPGTALYALSLGTDPTLTQPDDSYTKYGNRRIWFSSASPNYTPGLSANPDRYISCDIKGTDGSYASIAGATFTETMQDWSSAVPACPTLPAEVLPDTTTLTLHTVGGSDQVLWTSKLPPETAQALTGKYKTCLSTVCQLILKKNGVSCFDGADCTGWFTDPARDTTYTCEYASQAVALSECTVYAPTWQPDALRTGEVYGDPITGKPAPNSPDPIERAAAPVKGTDNATQTAPHGNADDPSRECFPGGWSVFNPIEWVQKPIQCAFSWAFIPRASVLKATQDKVTTALDNSGLGTIQRNTTNLALVGIPGGGCGGIPLRFDLGGSKGVHVDTHILAACPGDPLAPAAATTKTILTGLIITAGFLSILRYIATIFGMSGLGGIEREFRMSEKRAEAAGRSES